MQVGQVGGLLMGMIIGPLVPGAGVAAAAA